MEQPAFDTHIFKSALSCSFIIRVLIALVLWVGHLGLLLAGRFRVFGLGVGGGRPTEGSVPGAGSGVVWLVGAGA